MGAFVVRMYSLAIASVEDAVMRWSAEKKIPLGQRQSFNVYADWEAAVRPDFAQPKDEMPARQLWQPVYAEVNIPDAGDVASIVDQILAYVGDAFLIAQDSLAILERLKGNVRTPAPIDLRFIVYRPANRASEEPPSRSGAEPLYHVLRIGPAVPRSQLSAGAPEPPQPIEASLTPGPVVTAVIDDSIGIANERFRKPDNTTRISQFWKQGVEGFAENTGGFGVVLGQEFSATDIDRLLRDAKSEEAFYAALDAEAAENAWYVQAAPLLQKVVDLAVAIEDSAPGDKRQELIDELAILFQNAEKDGTKNALIPFLGSTLFSDAEDFFDQLITTANLKDVGITNRLRSIANLFDRLYQRRFGDHATHGTGVLDLAAGWPLEDGADAPPIFAVELPPLATVDSNGARLEFYVLHAVHRILYWADHFETGDGAQPVPVVINLSYGISAGPKNGQGFLESQIAELVAARNRDVATVVVMPSGNGYRGQLAATHKLDREAEAVVTWHVPAGDQTPSFAEIRLNRETGWTVTVTPPTGSPVILCDFDPNNALVHSRSNEMAVYVHRDPANTGGVLITLALAPTLTVAAPYHNTPSGAFKLKVENTSAVDALDVTIDVQRDDTPGGFASFGRQGYLEDHHVDGLDDETGNYQLPSPDSSIDRDATLSALATAHGEGVYVVGGAFENDHRNSGTADSRRPTTYTASGAGLARQPDVSAISETGRALAGVLVTGPFSGSSRLIDGTSAAAPQVTRALAAYLQKRADPDLPPKADILKDVLSLPSGLPAQDARLGHGTLPAPAGSDLRRHRHPELHVTLPPTLCERVARLFPILCRLFHLFRRRRDL